MAQRTVHAMFGVLLRDRLELTDSGRFLLGSILPDSYADPGQRQTSHFIKSAGDEGFLYFDFHDFLESFNERVMTDELYLGYYAHLVEDAIYRYFLYYEKGWMQKLKSYKLDILHKDYAILNSYVVRRYPLPCRIVLPEGFDAEPLHRITKFDAEALICKYENDLLASDSGTLEMLTEDVLEEFAAKYVDILTDELRAVRRGRSLLNAADYRWERKNA